jgi:hypothetical protein
MIIYVPKDQAVIPRSGECVVDNWWVVHPEHGLLFYIPNLRYHDFPTPQCNTDEHAAVLVRDRLYFNCLVEKFPVVYLSHAAYADRRTAEQLKQFYANGKPMWSKDGTMLDDRGNRSIFDDVDQ